MESFHIAENLLEYKVFRCENGFAAHVVGVHALPASGKGATVEDNVDSVVCGIAENVLVEAHCFLLVTAEEVDLDALHAVVFQPLHLFFTYDGAVHLVGGALHDVVPVAARRVPEQGIDAFFAGIAEKFGHAVVADVLVPACVDKYVFIAEVGGKVDESLLVFHIHAVVLPYNPAPCAASGACGVLDIVLGLNNVPRNCCFGYRCEVVGNSDCAPGGCAGQRDAG